MSQATVRIIRPQRLAWRPPEWIVIPLERRLMLERQAEGISTAKLTAALDGTVQALRCAVGGMVEEGRELIELTEAENN